MATSKEGFKTSEFVVAMAIIGASSILLAIGSIGEPLWAELTKWIGGAYIVSRGLAK